MDPRDQVFDCIIVGGGAAGLTAAIYLARYRRRIRLIDAGASRVLSIPTSHNYPGFAAGIHGRDLLQRLRAQADHYGVAVTPGVVERLEQSNDLFSVALGGARWRARQLLLATGVVDVEPDFPEVKRAVAEGRVRYCPVCDGYEAIGKNVAVLGRGSGGIGEARFMRHFADAVSLFSVTQAPCADAREQAKMEEAGVRVVPDPVKRLAFDDGGAMQLQLRSGERESFDVVYVALGTLVNTGLAQALGAACNDGGELIVDAHQQTSIDGLYAAGDIVTGLNQITVAMGHAAIAATAIHNRLGRRRR
jgi:thioredoxin reductase (NADPH)